MKKIIKNNTIIVYSNSMIHIVNEMGHNSLTRCMKSKIKLLNKVARFDFFGKKINI